MPSTPSTQVAVPYPSGRRLVRVAAVLAAAVALVVGPAGAASAHGGGGEADATNYLSTITGLVRPSSSGDPAESGDTGGIEGLTWRVRAGDSLLEVENGTGRELTVPGYQEEPYLRISGSGVYENRRSPAVYLNQDRYAAVDVPPQVDPDADPQWVKIADGSRYAWHDHRIHYMAGVPPPVVTADPGSEHVVFEAWEVPFALGDEEYAVAGQLRWIPGPAPWPWAAMALVGAGPLLPALLRPRAGRRSAVLRAVACTLLCVAAVDLLHLVDDLLAAPATLGEKLSEGGRSLAFIVVAVLGARAGLRGRKEAWVGVLVGIASLAGSFGALHLASLTSSQVVSVAPAVVTRAVVALNLGLVVPAVAVLVVCRRPLLGAQRPVEPVSAEVPG